MPNGFVSVIIPTKNRALYLKQAIESVYRQTCQSFEIIVVDDGGVDGTKDIVKLFDGRVQYYFQEAAGVSAARNLGISKARGEYIAFLDDDDVYLPERLAGGVDYLSHHPDKAWVCSGFSFIDAHNNPLPRDAILPQKTEITLHDIAMFTFISTCSVTVRKTMLDKVGGFPQGCKASEDYHLWAKIMRLGAGGVIQKDLVRYRQHAGNTKLPFHILVRENTRIIDEIVVSNAPGLMPREVYMQNLKRIVGDTLKYRRDYLQYAAFSLYWLFLTTKFR